MAIIDVNWNPNRKDLRVFGIGALVATSILSVLLHFRKDLPIKWAAAIVAFGLIIFISTLILPKLARIIYVVMVAVAFPIGMLRLYRRIAYNGVEPPGPGRTGHNAHLNCAIAGPIM